MFRHAQINVHPGLHQDMENNRLVSPWPWWVKSTTPGFPTCHPQRAFLTRGLVPKSHRVKRRFSQRNKRPEIEGLKPTIPGIYRGDILCGNLIYGKSVNHRTKWAMFHTSSSIKLPQGKGKQWGVYWDKPEETVRTGHDQQSCGGWGEGYFTKDGTITTINHSSRWISFGSWINNH